MAEDYTKLPVAELLRPEGFACPYCGRVHKTGLRYLRCRPGALEDIPEVLAGLGAKRPFVFCDDNTWQAAGRRVTEILSAAGIDYTLHVFHEPDLEPDERAAGSLALHWDRACDIIMPVGSGVLNDLGKVIGHVSGLQTVIVGTAPSMDGYASNSSSMLMDGIKVTLYNKCPAAIIADIDVLRQAPMRMIQSGLGDVIAKYISICEWRISHIVTGEAYCEGIATLVRHSLEKLTAAAGRLTERDPQTVESIVEGLILAGMAMAFAECSRPASGLEHYFSHIWDMMCLERGMTADLHGIQVGVGTVLTMRLYQWLRAVRPDREKALAAMAAFDPDRWEKDVERIFGKIAPNILEIERKAKKNDPEKHRTRLDALCAHWDEILRVMDEELPPIERFEAMMRSAGMPMLPKDLSFPATAQDVRDALRGSRDIRDKYLGSSILWDLGLMDEACERVIGCAEME